MKKDNYDVFRGNLQEVKKMVGLESSMDLAECAKKVKKPEVAEAEKLRQKEFYAKLRARPAEQPKGAQYD